MHGRRRRHRSPVRLAVAVLALVLGAGAAIAGIVRMDDDAGPQSPTVVAPVNSPPARTPLQQTLGLDPRTGYATAVRTSDAGRQTLTAQTLAFGNGEKRRYGGEVTLYERGAFDPARLRGAAPLTVRDHSAWLVTDFAFPESTSRDGRPYRTEVVGWQDPSGVWLLVYAAPGATVPRDELLRFAATVTVGAQQDLRAPFRLGPLPADLTPTYVRFADIGWDDRNAATVGLSAADRRPSDAAVYDAAPPGTAVSVTAGVPGRNDPEKPAQFTVAGHDAWYSTGTNPLSAPGAGGKLTVTTPGCTITVEAADRKRTSRAALQRLVEDMTIGDCHAPDTWISPLS